ncbi:MAG: transcriptional repressor [Dehalococcoidia bacterium]|nr:transcriptional repressor [Dehalococcoidia bacterium]
MSCIQVLKAKGYRLTPQRIMVVDALHCAKRHISAEGIFERLKKKYPYANISTVYRTLELLKELGLAAEISIGDGVVRYHARENSRHHHLVCTKCGKIVDMAEDELLPLEKELLKNHGFKADLNHLAIFGMCTRCREIK